MMVVTSIVRQYRTPLKNMVVVLGILFSPLAMGALPDPVDTLEGTLNTITADISNNAEEYRKDKTKLYRLIDRQVIPIIDVSLFSRAVLGKHSRVVSPKQLAEFQAAFKDFLISSYGEALLQYEGETVDFNKSSVSEGKRTTAIVDTVLHSGAEDHDVTYKMILNEQNQWKIYDVLFEDLSLGINFRNSYSDIIDRDGLDYLINLLKDKSAPAQN